MSLTDQVAEALRELLAFMDGTDYSQKTRDSLKAAILRYGDLRERLGREAAEVCPLCLAKHVFSDARPSTPEERAAIHRAIGKKP